MFLLIISSATGATVSISRGGILAGVPVFLQVGCRFRRPAPDRGKTLSW
jgi:hypothetical protein